MARTSVTFTQCPTCHIQIGAQGLARHLAGHNGTATRKAAKPVKLDANQRMIIKELAEHPGSLSKFASIYQSALRKLVKAGLVTESLELTEKAPAL